jgi:hypothetical protein
MASLPSGESATGLSAIGAWLTADTDVRFSRSRSPGPHLRPFRKPNVQDDNEFILLRVPDLLGAR